VRKPDHPTIDTDPNGMANSVGVSHLSDILVSDFADLLNISRTLRDTFERVSRELKLILDVGGRNNLNAGLAGYSADDFLSKEVSAM
jgi:hypothetical protein